jgi:hypothetical protein
MGNHFLVAIRETMYRRSTALSTRHLVIQRSALGDAAGIIGGSILAIEEHFARRGRARRSTKEGPFFRTRMHQPTWRAPRVQTR